MHVALGEAAQLKWQICTDWYGRSAHKKVAAAVLMTDNAEHAGLKAKIKRM